MSAQQTKDLLRVVPVPCKLDGCDCEEAAAATSEPESYLETFTVMSPKGWVGPDYQARDSDDAAAQAEADGYEIVDVMDFTLVTPDEAPYDLPEPPDLTGLDESSSIHQPYNHP
jgi:hypothetical protein